MMKHSEPLDLQKTPSNVSNRNTDYEEVKNTISCFPFFHGADHLKGSYLLRTHIA